MSQDKNTEGRENFIQEMGDGVKDMTPGQIAPPTDLPSTMVNERSRTYTYLTESGVFVDKVFYDVKEVWVRPSGNHRLRTGDGKYHIVFPGYKTMTFDIDGWEM